MGHGRSHSRLCGGKLVAVSKPSTLARCCDHYRGGGHWPCWAAAGLQLAGHDRALHDAGPALASKKSTTPFTATNHPFSHKWGIAFPGSTGGYCQQYLVDHGLIEHSRLINQSPSVRSLDRSLPTDRAPTKAGPCPSQDMNHRKIHRYQSRLEHIS